MQDTFLSKHKHRLTPVMTLLLFFHTVVFLATAGSALLSVHFWLARQMTISECVFTVAFGGLMAGLFGYLLFVMVTRILAVKEIRLLTEQRVEIVTWTRRDFIARIPENVRHAVLTKDMLTLAFRIDTRNFVIDSAEYSDGTVVNNFFRSCGQI